MAPGEGGRLSELAHQLGREVVAPHAEDVDNGARFPTEAFDAFKTEKLLSAYVPEEFGGMGCSIADIADACFILGQYCASTAMIYAMHQIQVACIVHHATESEFFQGYLKRLVQEQRLIASATSEIGTGGDLRSSVCGVEVDGDSFNLAKQAPVISYGEAADDLLVTCRSAPDAPASDQVAVLLLDGQYELGPFTTWDTLGFRGTCSIGFKVSSAGKAEQIIPVPFADVASATMLPVSHIVWTSLWSGLATDAVNLAREFVRAAARKNPGGNNPASLRLAEVASDLQLMRANTIGCVADYQSRLGDMDALSGFGFAIRMNNVKVAASQMVVDVVSKALLVCGIGGYKNDSKFSLSRHLRDAYGAALMINNDRILNANASMLMVHKDG